MIVGSQCVEYLTEEDRSFAENLVGLFKSISKSLRDCKWSHGLTAQKNTFIYTTFKNHRIRIYGKYHDYSYQILLKKKGVNFYEFGDFYNLKGMDLSSVKELSFIALMGKIEKDSTKETLNKSQNPR